MKFETVKNAPEGITLPTRSTTGSCGYDFYTPESVVVMPGDTVQVKSFVKAKIDPGYFLAIYIRSSMGIKRKISIANGTGIIDADYYGNPANDGNIIFALHNYGDEPQYIKADERVCQGVFMPFGVVEDDKAGSERSGGIGSTGV